MLISKPGFTVGRNTLLNNFSAGRHFMADVGTASATMINAQFFLHPMRIAVPTEVTQLGICNGATASGNWNLAIYGQGGVQLCTTGLVAQTGTNVLQVANVLHPCILARGTYYFAQAIDNATGTFLNSNLSSSLWRIHGGWHESTVGTLLLPAKLTYTKTSNNYRMCRVVVIGRELR